MQELQSDILLYYRTQKQSLNLLKRSLEKNNILTDDIEGIKKQISPSKLIGVVESYFDADVSIRSRKGNIIFARKAAAYILKKHTKLSLIEIAKFIGVGDHSTVLYNVRACNNLISTEQWYFDTIKQIELEIAEYFVYLHKK